MTLNAFSVGLSTPLVLMNTGYPLIDEALGNLRSGGCYLIAGAEKSGKSSFLMNVLAHIVTDHTVGIVDTETNARQFAVNACAVVCGKTKEEIEQDQADLDQWASDVSGRFYYASAPDIMEGGSISLNKTINRLNGFVGDGATVLIVDNLTTYATQGQGHYKTQWEALSSAINRLVAYAKEKNVIIFIVIHTRRDTVFTESPDGIRKLIKANDPQRIFQESVTISRRPSLADVYGGGAALSQLSGALLVWRPYQKFSDDVWQSMAALIVDSSRYGFPRDVKFRFDGKTGKCTELGLFDKPKEKSIENSYGAMADYDTDL